MKTEWVTSPSLWDFFPRQCWLILDSWSWQKSRVSTYCRIDLLFPADKLIPKRNNIFPDFFCLRCNRMLLYLKSSFFWSKKMVSGRTFQPWKQYVPYITVIQEPNTAHELILPPLPQLGNRRGCEDAIGMCDEYSSLRLVLTILSSLALFLPLFPTWMHGWFTRAMHNKAYWGEEGRDRTKRREGRGRGRRKEALPRSSNVPWPTLSQIWSLKISGTTFLNCT